jgi:hypothetical protein
LLCDNCCKAQRGASETAHNHFISSHNPGIGVYCGNFFISHQILLPKSAIGFMISPVISDAFNAAITLIHITANVIIFIIKSQIGHNNQLHVHPLATGLLSFQLNNSHFTVNKFTCSFFQFVSTVVVI